MIPFNSNLPQLRIINWWQELVSFFFISIVILISRNHRSILVLTFLNIFPRSTSALSLHFSMCWLLILFSQNVDIKLIFLHKILVFIVLLFLFLPWVHLLIIWLSCFVLNKLSCCILLSAFVCLSFFCLFSAHFFIRFFTIEVVFFVVVILLRFSFLLHLTLIHFVSNNDIEIFS